MLPWSEPSRYRRYGRQPSEICLRSHGAHLTDASSIAVDAALRSYGIAGGAFRLTDAAHKVAKAPGSLDGGGRQARICDAQEDRSVISELNDLLMLHDERARVASGEVLSNIVALIPRYGVSALLLELPEAWRRALVTWLVEAYDNTYPIEDFEGIHNPGVREQIQGARAWMEVDSSYRDYIVNDVAALHAMTNDRLYSRHDLMHQLVRLAAQRGAAPTPSFEREATLPLAHRAFALGWAHDAVPSPADELLHIARVSDLSDIRPEDKQHLAGPPSPARCVVGPA